MPGYRALTRNRDFTILWIGETVSELGTTMSLFAIPLLGYHLSGSAVTAAWVEAAHLLGLCAVLLPAGVLADRVDRKRLMMACSAVGLAAFGSLALAGALGHLTLIHLAVSGLLGGAAFGCMMPAQSSAIRSVVSTEDLPTALSQNQARQHVAGLLGGPIAGFLYAVTRWLPFAADAATFVVSLLTLSHLRTDLSPDPTIERSRGILRPVREGFAFIGGQAFLRVLAVWAAGANLVFNALFFVVMIRMLKDGYATTWIGLTSTAAGLGGLLGAAVAPSIIERTRTGTLTVAIAWATALPVVPLIWWSHPAAVAACLFVFLLLNPAGNAGISAYRMAMTPDHLQGRVSSALQFASMGLMPLAPLAGGILLERLGGGVAVAAAVVAGLLLALLVSSSRSIREVPRPCDWQPSPNPVRLPDDSAGATRQ